MIKLDKRPHVYITFLKFRCLVFLSLFSCCLFCCYIYGISLFSIVEGHQGLFIKHSSSGLCLQSAETPRLKGNGRSWGPVYVVHFYNTCLHPDAQFRFFQQFSVSVLYNIGQKVDHF